MNVQSIALIIYAVLLTVAAAVAGLIDWSRSAAVTGYTALRSMPANHLVLSDDVRAPSSFFARTPPTPLPLVGQYARHAIRTGEEVSQESFAAVPAVDVSPMLSVRVERALVTGHRVDAGDTVKLCVGTTAVDVTRAHALLCAAPAPENCVVLVAVDPRMLANASRAPIFAPRAVPERDQCQ